ncbi:MAG: glycosyltransferase family 2 protein [Candidatus Aminicenantales bacterium]
MEEEVIGTNAKKPELTVIIVGHNSRVHLERCLASLEREGKSKEAEVILVDNHSSDGTQALVKQSFPWVSLIENKENVGYARANNQGIQSSRANFILFLNPDTAIPKGALSFLLQELKERPERAAIAPRLVREDGVFQVSFGRKPDFFGEAIQKLLLNPYFRLKLRFSVRPREVGWLSGACLLVRRSALEEAGFFDENFFLYFEDIDLCVRLRKNGYRLVFDPRVLVLHLGQASTSAHRLLSRIEYRRSQIYFYKKHNSRLSLFLLKIYLKVFFAFWTFFVLKRREEKALWREKVRGLFNGK